MLLNYGANKVTGLKLAKLSVLNYLTTCSVALAGKTAMIMKRMKNALKLFGKRWTEGLVLGQFCIPFRGGMTNRGPQHMPSRSP
jgi:hypothetical protein